MAQRNTVPHPSHSDPLSCLLQCLSSLCENGESAPLQLTIRRNNREATLTIGPATIPEAENAPLRRASSQTVERDPAYLEQAIVNLLGEVDRPLKAAAIAQRLGVTSDANFQKTMTRLRKDKIICKTPKHPQYYWLNARPLPSDF